MFQVYEVKTIIVHGPNGAWGSQATRDLLHTSRTQYTFFFLEEEEVLPIYIDINSFFIFTFSAQITPFVFFFGLNSYLL